jgi:undecaprenyl-diphosphatase
MAAFSYYTLTYAKILLMINTIQAVILGALQGLTELFPISSLGHSVILPTVLGWNIDQSNNMFVLFLVATHLATALVLLGFFFKDWVLMAKGFFRSLRNRRIAAGDTYAKLSWLIIAATIPAGILGLLLQKKLQALFASPFTASIFLIFNGFLLYAAEYLKRRNDKKVMEMAALPVDEAISSISLWQSIKIGLAQCLALIPGFSRTGASLSGGLAAGLTHEEAARFSFLLATPIILAAAIFKLPALLHASADTLVPIVFGAVTAAIAAYFATKFLTRYFAKQGERHSLIPFAKYCIFAGIIFALIIAVIY